MIRCEFPGSRSPLMRGWHLLRCPECRNAKSADAIIERGLQRLRAEPAPSEGLARTLAAVGAAPTLRSRRPRWQKAVRHPYVPAGALTVLAAAGTAGWLAYIDLDVKISIPTPAMPAPNAYDFLRKAVDAIPAADKNTGTEAAQPAHARIDAALTNTPAAAKNQMAGGLPARRYATHAEQEAHHVYTLKEKVTLLREYAPALKLLRQGFAYPYQSPPIRSNSTTLPYLGSARYFARVFSLEAQVKAEQSDLAGAAESSLDAMELGAQIPHGSALMGGLTGIACDAIGHVALWKIVNRLTAVQARAALRRLEHIDQVQMPFALTLQEEKWVTLATVQEILHRRDWRVRLSNEGSALSENESGSSPRLTGAFKYMLLLPYSKHRILNDFTQLMDHDITEAHKPYTARQVESDLNEGAPPRDPVMALLFPDFLRARFKTVASLETQHALLAATLALRVYHEEHHTYPNRLDDLVPKYLHEVPRDPFTRNEPLHYQRNVMSGTLCGYWLYSVGPDGIDDNGMAITGKDSNSTARYRVDPDSKGDIVAGLNVN